LIRHLAERRSGALSRPCGFRSRESRAGTALHAPIRLSRQTATYIASRPGVILNLGHFSKFDQTSCREAKWRAEQILRIPLPGKSGRDILPRPDKIKSPNGDLHRLPSRRDSKSGPFFEI